ncbi:MAG: T9SS type A sorting domain-containing protein [Bacteroidetes bacterium]|nr:T9SS type A sorting domain-containing protein [Bacteroidota bacterium]
MKKIYCLILFLISISGIESTAQTVKILEGDTIRVCGDSIIQLKGFKSGNFSTLWTTIGGTGKFSTPKAKTTNYTFSEKDYSNGKIKIIFRHALKSKIADTVTVLLGKKPKVGFIVDECKDVNNFQYFSENSNKIELKTLGDGYFDYSDYQYGPEDCEKGEVTLIICATNFNCNLTVSDTVTFNIPECQIEVDILMSANGSNCELEGPVRLEAFFSEGVEFLGGWSSTGSGSFSSAQSNGTVIYYTPSPEDLELGYVNITTNFGGDCYPLGEYTKTLFFGKPAINFQSWESGCGDESTVLFFDESDKANDTNYLENIEGIKHEIIIEGDGKFNAQYLKFGYYEYTPGPMDRLKGYFKVTFITKNPLFPDCPADTNEILVNLASAGHIYATGCPTKLIEDKPTECLNTWEIFSEFYTKIQWYKSTTGCGNWELIPNATDINYDPGIVKVKTCYIRKVLCINRQFIGGSDTCIMTSNCVCVETCPNDEPVPDTIKDPKSTYERLNKINNFGLSLSPNPAFSQIRIQLQNELQQDFELSIYNLLGEKIVGIETNNTDVQFDKSIDISNFINGVYLVNVRFLDGTVITQKFIKQ